MNARRENTKEITKTMKSKYAKFYDRGAWYVVEWIESVYDSRLGWWDKMAKAVDKYAADTIIRALNRAENDCSNSTR